MGVIRPTGIKEMGFRQRKMRRQPSLRISALYAGQMITQEPCVFLSPAEPSEQREQSQMHLSYAESRGRKSEGQIKERKEIFFASEN